MDELICFFIIYWLPYLCSELICYSFIDILDTFVHSFLQQPCKPNSSFHSIKVFVICPFFKYLCPFIVSCVESGGREGGRVGWSWWDGWWGSFWLFYPDFTLSRDQHKRIIPDNFQFHSTNDFLMRFSDWFSISFPSQMASFQVVPTSHPQRSWGTCGNSGFLGVGVLNHYNSFISHYFISNFSRPILLHT